MSRIVLAALVAASLAFPAAASGTLTVTVSDRGASSPHSDEAQRIFEAIAAERN
jgi:hypothetical protein